ncbi:fibronectin type III domain-containing protein [Bullifex sp.]|uniref:fibronectin type III domain-containing protein n=1 Tax=Bullifex sp. TaxID=2815808 RepID=UPI002A830A78|nr:fibronectin type III domain-containing protein [Bullifex sp.]MDY4066676.1 fibronectin type III domain-containing protein [Bullifex sp.]
MRKLILLLLTILLISCNASILMTNGEVTKPGNSSSKDNSSNSPVFSGEAPRTINATKSYYTNKIVIRWSSVEGADYYTLERCEHLTPEFDEDAVTFKEIEESILDTFYTDETNLKVGVYYTYRVKAHTFDGNVSKASIVTTGTILSSPSNISASKGTSISTIDIEWTQMPNVESYNIYRSTLSSVSGLESEYIATVQASRESYNLAYSYQIEDGKENGKELFFAIEGVGPTGNSAKISLPRSGYTFIPGAPSSPAVPYVTKADSTDSITLKFRSQGASCKYLIKRYYPGSSEMIIFSEDFGNELSSPDADGYYTYVDTDVKENVEYTYSVIAYNDIGSSPATVVTGYLLSPVRNVTLLPKNNIAEIGYELNFDEPVGAGDSQRTEKYCYQITGYSKDGNKLFNETKNEGNVVSLFRSVDKIVTKESQLKELWYIDVKVTLGSLESKVIQSEKIPMLPEPITTISASKNRKPLDSEEANINGVYPVTIKWESSFTGERILTRNGSDGSVKKFNITGGTEFVDTTGEILVIYDYFIDTSDSFGRTLGEIKHTGDSYGAITPNKFAAVLDSVSMKPFEIQTYVPAEYKQYWKKSKIAEMVGYGNASDLSTQMKALGTAEDKDHFGGGTIKYEASMEGVGGQIYFSYNNFGENENFKLTGNYEMHVNASGTGKAGSNTGGLTVKGMYPAKISLEKISVSNKAFVGSYIFTFSYSDGEENYEVKL